jgi:NAD(P)-dependent dehydrogenase (short-subunit alcohol dehydrogenase family)
MNFDGKVVLVTGASRGIGRACAQRFADYGARIAIHYHSNREAAEQTLASLPDREHLIVQAEIGDAGSVQGMVETVVREMGGLHVLVNNAGIFEEHPLPHVSYEEWQATIQRILNTNLIGAANVTADGLLPFRHERRFGGSRKRRSMPQARQR